MGVCIGQMIAITVKGAASKVAAQQNAKAALPGGDWEPNYDQSYSHNGSTYHWLSCVAKLQFK